MDRTAIVLSLGDLVKSIRPEDLKSVFGADDPSGVKLVNHVPDLTAHPPTINNEVDDYRKNVLASPKPVAKQGRTGLSGGITRKSIFKTKTAGAEQKYMVKPYHEKIVTRCKGWMQHPHQGWAEMTNQTLYHAGGIGHLHQKVHVSEHAPGKPALVVHITPGHTDIASGGSKLATDQTRADVRKIALMDFLSNNIDRHGGNLMVSQTGQPLAIDHSRSFQYKAARVSMDRKVSGQDRFSDYVNQSSISTIDPMLRHIPAESGIPGAQAPVWKQQEDAIERYNPTFEWWGENSPKIREAFHQRLGQIQDPDVRDHLKRNFDARADFLDDRARHGVDNFGADWYNDRVSNYQPGELTEDEQEDPAVVEEQARRRSVEFQKQKEHRARTRAYNKKMKELTQHWEAARPNMPTTSGPGTEDAWKVVREHNQRQPKYRPDLYPELMALKGSGK